MSKYRIEILNKRPSMNTSVAAKDECTESDFWCGTAGEQYYQKPEGYLLSEQELHDVEYGLRSLSDDEKQWCLSEIASVEGYERCDYEDKTDSCIAYGVFCAWTDYCRDKGLI